MTADVTTLYKLIILTMLDKVDFPLTFAQISAFILDKGYTDFFTVRQVLSELEEAHLVRDNTIGNATQYTLTDAGRETLSYFGHEIPPLILDDIIDYLEKNQITLRDETSVMADYFETKKDEYLVRCIIKEQDSTLLELHLTVPGQEEATAACDHFRKKNQEIYTTLLSLLLS